MKMIKIVVPAVLLGFTQITMADGNFKRFSVSAGWMHVMPQGKANPFNISTKVPDGTTATVGAISPDGFLSSLDPNQLVPDTDVSFKDALADLVNNPVLEEFLKNEDGTIKSDITGTATLNGLGSWTQQGSGLEADDVDTLGLMVNYYVNDNVSLQLIGGIPPKVDIKGKGNITASMNGVAHTGLGLELDLLKDIPITDLGSKSKAATARAWTPAIEAQYQFGRSGVNKFRPYVGAGLMYAYFNDIKLNPEIRSDLEAAGHMIQNVLDDKGGAALDGKESSGKMVVDVDADDAIAPIVTVGFTYDFSPNWFTAASVSYAKLNNKTKIDVINQTTGEQLIHATTKIDIDPIITYLGVGYRF